MCEENEQSSWRSPCYPDQVDKLLKQYKKWVLTNPQSLSEIEALVKWGSYFLAGRFVHSSLLCEIVYSGSRLFELFNDCLLKGKLPHLSLQQENRIKVLLTVLESVEVVIEVGATQFWGEKGKWAVVATIQLIKLMWRLVLLLRDQLKLVPSPAIVPLDRKNVSSATAAFDHSNSLGPHNITFQTLNTPDSTRLPHSGLVMKTLSSASPPHLRNYLPSPPPATVTPPAPAPPLTSRTSRQLLAEVLHVFRPVSHLGSLYMFGQKSWLPYLFSLFMDASSLHLHRGALLTPHEREELSRRQRSILLYLLRSPAYQSVTEQRLNALFAGVGTSVPFTRNISDSLRQYLQHWQTVYCHSWGI
uniref:Peroxisomal membrane protein PEX16 n=1 Tax=Hirondellea gigas TaxID=1518452 RepID=A0A2P2I4C3_9CRUS